MRRIMPSRFLQPLSRIRLWIGDAAAVLSAREREVLRWVARGKSNDEIATALYISEATVRKHLQNAYKKLDVTSRTAAIALLSGSEQRLAE